MLRLTPSDQSKRRQIKPVFFFLPPRDCLYIAYFLSKFLFGLFYEVALE